MIVTVARSPLSGPERMRALNTSSVSLIDSSRGMPVS